MWLKQTSIFMKIIVVFIFSALPQLTVTTSLKCPDGSHQVGAINADIGGCGLQSCDDRYDVSTIEECRDRCDRNINCKAFNWAPLNGDRNHMDKKVCTMYNADAPTSSWSPNQIFCDILDCDESLSGNGADYGGCQSVSISSQTCKPWDRAGWSQEDYGYNHNYCRNPDGKYSTIGCYTRTECDEDEGMQDCYLAGWQYCSPIGLDCDESLSGNGANYRGCQFVSRSGQTCKKWTESSVSGLGDHNYCRNPDGMYSTIGCYTQAGWQYCIPIPRCAHGESLDPYHNGGDYVGCQTRTVSGKVCQKWTPENYPSGASWGFSYYNNYCRNPNSDEKDTIWCFTSDSGTESEWEYCVSLTTMIGTDQEYAEHFAPVLMFDSNAEGFPTIYDYPNGNGLKQNFDRDISSIPTYYHVFRDFSSHWISRHGRVTTIGYYWYYAYQSECMVDGIDVSIHDAVDGEIEDIIHDVITYTGQNLGAHNDDRERIFVHLHEDGLSVESVTYHQHNGHYTVPYSDVDILFGQSLNHSPLQQMHPYVYIGRTSHGSYQTKETEVGGCGYFADYRDGAIQRHSWMNLHDAVSADPTWIVDQPREVYKCDDDTAACDWEKCKSSSDLYNNAQLCTPLTCERMDTGCMPFGYSDVVEAAIEGMEDTNDLYWVFKDISDPDCDPYPFAGESIHFTFCYPDL